MIGKNYYRFYYNILKIKIVKTDKLHALELVKWLFMGINIMKVNCKILSKLLIAH